MLNEILLIIVAALFVALIFARHLTAIINYVLNLRSSHVGVRVMSRKRFSDVETGQPFEVWQGVNGFRLALVSLILKF